MRTKIKEKLLELEVDERIHYGLVPDNVSYDDWNYFVFGQQKIRKSGSSRIDLNTYWYVVIVRENFIPDDDIENVLKKLNEIPGLRLADGEYQYTYAMNGNTNNIVEMVMITYTKTKTGVVSCHQ